MGPTASTPDWLGGGGCGIRKPRSAKIFAMDLGNRFWRLDQKQQIHGFVGLG